LLNGEDPEEIFDCIQEQPNNREYETPTVQEINTQIKRLKNHKSPDEDGIQGEILKCVDETMIEMIHKLIEKIWNTEEIPKDWNIALIFPIHKNDDKKVCNNYRGIAIVNITYKILSYCILDRIKPLAKNSLGDYQGRFRENKSTIDQIFIIRQLAQKTWEFDQELHSLFADFKKAYDSINRENIYKILEHFRIAQKLIGRIN